MNPKEDGAYFEWWNAYGEMADIDVEYPAYRAGKAHQQQQNTAELADLRARVEAAEAKVAKLFTSDAQSVDEFNAGYQAFEAGMDLDTAEQNYYSVLPDDVPHHDSFGTGYAWAKFVTERAALAKGAK